MAGPRKRFALDTNLIYDLAEGKDFAHTFIEVFKEKGYELLLPPTAVQELAFAVQHEAGKKKLARRGLTCLREWGIREFDLVAVGHGITETFSLFLQARGLLPSGENNDGLILAETSLAAIDVLVTSDRHLLDIDPEKLKAACKEKDLSNVSVFHPKKLLKAMNVKPR
jgi:predicted nucleic acid-binding protein